MYRQNLIKYGMYCKFCWMVHKYIAYITDALFYGMLFCQDIGDYRTPHMQKFRFW